MDMLRCCSNSFTQPILRGSRLDVNPGSPADMARMPGLAALTRRFDGVGGHVARSLEPTVFQEFQQARRGCVSSLRDGCYFGRRRLVAPQGVQSSTLMSAQASISQAHEEIGREEQPHLHLQVEQFYLPEIRCSFPPKCHPDYEEIREEVEPWLLECKRPHTEEEKELLLQSNLLGVVCWTTPESLNKDRMLLVSKFVSWICCFDDESDETEQMGTDATAVKSINESINNALDGRDTDQDIDRPDVKAICSVLRQIRADMSPSLRKRHAETLSRGLFSFETQADLRQKSGMPDLDTYISTRRKTYCFSHIQLLIQYCLGVELDEETLECLQELHNAVADYASWANDVLSFRREYFHGDLQNLPSVVYFHNRGKLDFQAAIYHACEMIRARERDFIRIFHEISFSDLPTRKPGLRTYLSNLPYVLSGHLHWYYTSARFHGVGHSLSTQREGMLQMIPERTVLIPREDEQMHFHVNAGGKN